MSFTIRSTKNTVHIQGIDSATVATKNGLSYALSACGALTRTRTRMSVGHSFQDLREALEAARESTRKLCKNCEKAAVRMLDTMGDFIVAQSSVPQDITEVEPGSDITVYTMSGQVITGVFEGMSFTEARISRKIYGLRPVRVRSAYIDDFEVFDGDTWVSPND